MKKNNDIEKYINDSIKAERPQTLSKENIVSMLSEGETAPVKHKDKTIRRFYKAVAVAAAFALLLGGVTVYENGKRNKSPAPVQDSGEISVNADYNELYAALDEMHERYREEHKNNIFSDIYGVISGAAQSSNDIAYDTAVPNDGLTGKNPETVNEAFGTTNTQEKGIDEGDIIKTDGKYIYLVCGGKTNIYDNPSQNVQIVKADSGKMQKVSALCFDTDNENESNIIQEIYLADGKLIVIYVNYDYLKQPQGSHLFHPYKSEASNGMDASFFCILQKSWVGSETHVNIYDISNPESPKLIEDFSQSGEYVSSRQVSGKLYVVSSFGVDIYSKDYKDYCIPETSENGVNERIPAEKITLVNDVKLPSYAVVSTLDVKTARKTDSSAVFSDATNVYATENSLYIVEKRYNAKRFMNFLNIVRFEFTDNGVKYVASAEVDGMLNDNLSMSEYGGYFRIATTCELIEIAGGNDESQLVKYLGQTNRLYILDGNLNRVGCIDSFAKDEMIRSARYIGNYAYVVTFRQTDPLFVINLSDPENPQIESALKLPGFSSYLHPIGDGLIVGIGQDGNAQNANGNMKVSLFSVADPKNPQELSNLLVGKKNYYVTSNITDSYKAFLTLPNGEFAIPFLIHSDDANNGTKIYARYKIENGELFEVARYRVTGDGYIQCGTYIGDYLYAFSYCYNYDEVNERSDYTYTLTSFNLKTNEKANEITLK